MVATHYFDGRYEGKALEHIHFPLGGLGSGMFCLDGTGAFSRFSLRHRPQIFHEPVFFSALTIKGAQNGNIARVLEGPVPPWKFFFPWIPKTDTSGNGCSSKSYGLPRFESAQFETRFPFATVSLFDGEIPIEVSLKGWSPFIPGDADATSLPVAAVDYSFSNPTDKLIEGIYSFHAKNFMAEGDSLQSVKGIKGGFHLRQEGTAETPSTEGSFAAWIDDSEAKADLAWFRGGWFDPLTMLWKGLEAGQIVERAAFTEGKPSQGGSIYLPFKLGPGEQKTVRLLLGWYVPYSTLRDGNQRDAGPNSEIKELDLKTDYFRPWYGEKFTGIEEIAAHWTSNVESLRARTQTFSDCFYDSTLPPEVIDAIAGNLAILKSPTVLRQFDGGVWAWEGCQDEGGSCFGTCTHVWNYAQALPHLFPDLERGLREVEFLLSQEEGGFQSFRAAIPIGIGGFKFHPAADGQLGGLFKIYREWRISGDTSWLKKMWPSVRVSLDYCIRTWDPDHLGTLVEPHHNTYDIEFWGADGMCTSFYAGALHAAVVIGHALKDDVSLYEKLLGKSRKILEGELFNGDYFIQKIQWKGLRSPDPVEMSKKTFNLDYSAEALELLHQEGPKYQYGAGCLSDGVIGEWMAWSAGLPPAISVDKIEKHLLSVHRHNFRSDLAKFPNPQRPAYAFGHEAGLIICSWPNGEKPSLPFPYSEEVWTGIEYQVASHLISLGQVDKGLQIVRAVRSRYDGNIRNPFDEIECGHWYARAMSSYALLQALSGARYDAVDKTLYLEPKIAGNFRSFIATQSGFGTVGVENGKPFLNVKAGQIELRHIQYIAK